jgi:mono/diheme cytochrome c family protein
MNGKLFVAALIGISTSAFAASPKATPGALEKGKASFAINCAPCHGNEGAGDGPAAAALNPRPRNFKTEVFKNGDSVESIFASVTKGLTGTAMIAFAHLPEEERWAISHFVASLLPGKAKSAEADEIKK